MSQSLSKKRPWLAAVLGFVATGLGHLYLRRWLRALGWFGLTTITAMLFVPESAISSLAAGEPVAWLDLVPLLVVSAISMVDAYQLAVVNNYRYRAYSRGAETDPTLCPSCSRPVDEDLDFCQWCATPLPESAGYDTSERDRQP